MAGAAGIVIVVAWYLFARRIPLGGIHPGQEDSQEGDGRDG